MQSAFVKVRDARCRDGLSSLHGKISCLLSRTSLIPRCCLVSPQVIRLTGTGRISCLHPQPTPSVGPLSLLCCLLPTTTALQHLHMNPVELVLVVITVRQADSTLMWENVRSASLGIKQMVATDRQDSWRQHKTAPVTKLYKVRPGRRSTRYLHPFDKKKKRTHSPGSHLKHRNHGDTFAWAAHSTHLGYFLSQTFRLGTFPPLLACKQYLYFMCCSFSTFGSSMCLPGKLWEGPRKRCQSGGEIHMLVRHVSLCLLFKMTEKNIYCYVAIRSGMCNHVWP